MTQKEFITKSKQKFPNQFGYEKLNFIDVKTPFILICKKHGEFTTTYNKHMYSKLGGCKKCRTANNKYTQNDFINKCKNIWGDYFSYENTIYVDSYHKITVTCPIHGDFLTNPADFLRKHGCPKCKGEKQKLLNKKLFIDTKEEFINKCKLKYPNLFEYDKVIYINSRIKVLIYSKLCDEYFYVLPSHLLCGQIKKKYLNTIHSNKKSLYKTTEAFIQEAKLIHGDKYNYDKCKYINSTTKVIVTCSKHGDFTIPAIEHTAHRIGCPKCAQSHGESIIDKFLHDRKLHYQKEYVVYINNKKYRIDFCLFYNKQKIFIEYNGKQHYQAIELFGGQKKFKQQKIRDKIIKEYCKINKIPLLVYKYTIPFNKLEDIIKKDLLYYDENFKNSP